MSWQSQHPDPLDDIQELYRQIRNLRSVATTPDPVKVERISAWITPGNINNDTVSKQVFYVPGLAADDMVVANGPSQPQGLTLTEARVWAQDYIELSWVNLSGWLLAPVVGTYYFTVFHT